jgi:DNA polymerase-3 subunit delta
VPVYLFWGDDTFRLQKSVQALQEHVLDPAWKSFNFDRVSGNPTAATEAFIHGLNQVMTPPFGQGGRLVWLANPPLTGQESSLFVAELERTLPVLPATAHLLLTYEGKPDGRSKIVKGLQQQGTVTEFSVPPPWKTEALQALVRQTAQEVAVSLTADAVDLLVEAVGSDTRLLFCELEKLKLFVSRPGKPTSTVGVHEVTTLVGNTQHNSLALANAIRQGSTDKALQLVNDLLSQNEPGLRISATLVKQFRTWLWVKLMQVAGERDERIIAQAAEVANPKRIYFLSQDVKGLTPEQLQQALGLLLDLEVALKQGQTVRETLYTKVIELCQVCGNPPLSWRQGLVS